MCDSNRIFPDISETDRAAAGRVPLRKLAVPILGLAPIDIFSREGVQLVPCVPAVYWGVVPLDGGGKAEPDEPLVADFVPRVPPLCGPAGAAVL